LVVDTLTRILAQLTTINKRLDIQRETIACHDQLLVSDDGSTSPSLTRQIPATKAVATAREALATAAVTMEAADLSAGMVHFIVTTTMTCATHSTDRS
jgi:hypothetical protein